MPDDKPTECTLTSCEEPAVRTPVLVLKAPVGDAEVKIGMPEVPVCLGHTRTLKVRDVLSDEGWEDIARQFTSRGLVVPVRASARLMWDPIQ